MAYQINVEQEVREISVITCARQKISKGTILPTPSNLPSDADDEDNCANALVTVAMKNPPDDLDPQESNALVPLRGRNYLPFIKNTRVYLRGISTHHLLPYVTASEIHNSISEATLPNPALMSYADNPREANALVYWNKEKTCFEILLLEDVDAEEALCLRVPKHSAQFHQPDSDAIIASDREIEDLGRRVLRLTRKGRGPVQKSTPPPSPAAPAAPTARLEKPPALESHNMYNTKAYVQGLSPHKPPPVQNVTACIKHPIPQDGDSPEFNCRLVTIAECLGPNGLLKDKKVRQGMVRLIKGKHYSEVIL